MDDHRDGMRVAYLHYGEQGGVTARVTEALEAEGLRVVPVFGRGPLELRDPATRRPRPTPLVLAHLAVAAARFGRAALGHRWNTPFAFDVHSRWAGELLAGLPAPVDVVLQNGALFAPGRPPPVPYVLLVDHTRALAEGGLSSRRAGGEPAWGEAWRRREAETYRAAAAVAAFSGATARSLREHYGVPPGRVEVVGAGPSVLPAEPRRRDDGATVLFLGRDFERCGGPLLLEAFARLRPRYPRARLRIAGPAGPLDLPAGAELLGPVAQGDVAGLLAEATVFALAPARAPSGLAYLDAMACAVPCVGTAVDAVPEVVEDGVTGLLVPPGDPGALAAALERLLGNAALARGLGERARERVLARWWWPAVGRRLAALLARARTLGPGAGASTAVDGRCGPRVGDVS